MYVLAIYGSPRKDGNTDLLLDEFLKGVSSTSTDTRIERLYVRDLKITPCLEYNACLKTGDCIIKDEMTPVYDKLLKADLIVLAAPVFFYSLPAQAKALIDRCQSLWARKYILKTMKSNQGRKGFFISVGGTKGENLFTGAVLTVKYFFKALNVEYAGDLLYRQVDAKGAIRNHPTALSDAFQSGLKMTGSYPPIL